MGEFNYNLYKGISKAPQASLHTSLEEFLVKRYGEDRVVEMKDGFVYAIGDTPIMLVAHLDTVHKQLPIDIFYDTEQQVIWSPEGIGADDRAGVYAIVELIKRGHRPSVLFTWDEEVGGVGAQVAASLLNPEVDYVIELDRRGYDDCVFYDCDNPVFTEYVESFGFKTNYGSFSDICYLCPEWKVAGVNLSIGYENEHTKTELLQVNWMMETINKVEEMLLDTNYDKDKFEFIESTYSATNANWFGTSTNSWAEFGNAFAYGSLSKKEEPSRYRPCKICGTHHHEDFMVPVDRELYCDECYDTHFDFCYKCRKSYILGQPCNCE